MPRIILDGENNSELGSSFISLNFLGRKDGSFFKDQVKKIYIFIYIFGNETILGTILQLLLSLVTSLIFSKPYA